MPNRLFRTATVLAASITLAACVGSYTGPVEVTRFVADNPEGLGQGPVVVYFPDEMSNEGARDAFAAAVSDELRSLGYTVVDQEGQDVQVATVRTSRGAIESAERSRSPVSVGVGGSTGSYGSGLGVGLGINLGGGQSGPAVNSELSVRITSATGETLWEGRSQIATSVNSPYSDVNASARTLSAALFRDFPGGNGETVTLKVDELPQ